MSVLKKFMLHDIKDLLREKKSMAVIVFINIIILAISFAFCLAINKDENSVYALFQNFSETEMDKISISSRLIMLYSLLLYTAFPLILGISAVSYLKEFGELELIMLFPVDRKKIFAEKTFCIFFVSTALAFLNFLLCALIQKLIFGEDFVLSMEMIFFRPCDYSALAFFHKLSDGFHFISLKGFQGRKSKIPHPAFLPAGHHTRSFDSQGECFFQIPLDSAALSRNDRVAFFDFSVAEKIRCGKNLV